MMDKLIYDMGIEMSYENPDDHVPEAERKNIVIKERFRIEYYRFTYKNTPMIMICNLAMNMTQNFNLFPSIGGVSAHYIQQIII